MNKQRVVLISCTKKKHKTPCEARVLYDASPLFRKSLACAQTISTDIYVLSAKYGLVPLNQVIEPYNETLNEKTVSELSAWGQKVAAQLAERYDIAKTEFIVLAGRNYHTPLHIHLPNITLPLDDLRIGERFAELDRLCGKVPSGQQTICYRLHQLFNSMPSYQWDEIDKIGFDNGIYICFETGEKYDGVDRIVRVGTHTSDRRLRNRLRNHFLYENKDASIFRKNIGKALLNKTDDPYLSVWRMDSSDRNAIISMNVGYDPVIQGKVEKRVSKYLREHVSFMCIPVASASERLRLEERIIATLNFDDDFTASDEWLGQYSPEELIAQSGMWLIQGLNGTPLSESEYKTIENYCSGGDDTASLAILPAPTPKPSDTGAVKMTTADIKHYIEKKLMDAKATGKPFLEVKAGTIHKELGLENRMPMVCNAMRKLQQPTDAIIYEPPKGAGSRFTIKYNL